jgi:hypothetical protein
MNEHQHGHHHSGHHHEEKPARQYHKDWRVWVAIVVILVAMGVYVLTNGEVLRPAPPPQQSAPAAPSK